MEQDPANERVAEAVSESDHVKDARITRETIYDNPKLAYGSWPGRCRPG